jgi:hypothetical protein
MAEPHVISALRKKRAHLLGKLNHYEQLARECKESLAAIDHSIYLFDNQYSLSAIKPKRVFKHKFFKHGEARKLVLDLLRDNKQLTNKEIYKLTAQLKQIKFLEGQERGFSKSLNGTLKLLEKQGILEMVNNPDNKIIWKIKEPDLEEIKKEQKIN